jgi:Ca2+-transporting ATPase
MRTIREVLDALPTGAETGLDPRTVDDSRRRFGSNQLTPLPRVPLWRRFLDKFDEPIIKILLAAALLSMFVELFAGNPATAGVSLAVVAVAVVALLALRRSDWVPGLLFLSAVALFLVGLIAPPHHPSVEGLAVMVAVILATGVAFLSEYRSDREFELLNAQKESLRAKVTRGGEFHTVPLEEVVVGDLVSLEMGDEVPADGRPVRCADLYVDQSLMTGEPEPVHKRPAPPEDVAEGFDEPGCLYRGTQVVDGVGQMLVTEVGDATALGQIARHLSPHLQEPDALVGAPEGGEFGVRLGAMRDRVEHKLTVSKELTPLQEKLKALAGLISKVGYTAAVLIFVALLARGLWAGEVFWPHDREGFLKVAAALLSYFMYMVIIIVVAVPEGLPMSVTVSLALAMRRMTRENALVRQLVACETIGSATVICSDKTGTLTQNRMQVVRFSWHGRTIDRGTAGWERPEATTSPSLRLRPVDWVARIAAVNSTANLEEKDGKLLVVGNSTEGALLLWLREAGVEYLPLRQQFPLLYTVHFSSDRKRMTSVVRQGSRLVSLVKGAPEWVLEHSTHYEEADGRVRRWTPESRAAALAAVRDSAARAMRTLAFGYAPLPPDAPDDEDALHARRDELEKYLVFVGVAAIRDPLREDVKAAVAECRRAGIDVKMITGDNVETARAIAADVGLVEPGAAIDTPDAPVLTSPALEALDDAALKARLPGLRVVARARPLDKYRLVKALQELGQVVAVTGDGTNDAPALKRADVGLAMGVAGTEVAKEASKIVLLDDAFSTIVKAVHWGRSLYENIQRFLQFQLTINASALTIALLGPLFGVKPPFTVLQLLWINVIMDTLASMALCSEPPRPGVMAQPPKRRDESILTRPMLWTIFTTAAFFVVVMMTLLAGMEWYGWFHGDGPRSAEFPELSARQVSIFFSAYVFFQVWNQVNCRSLTPDESGLSGLGRNPTFLAIAGAVALVQVLIVSVPPLAEVFKVEPLGVVDWLGIVGATASVLVFAELVRRVRGALGTA